MEKFKQWLEKDSDWKETVFVVFTFVSLSLAYMLPIIFFTKYWSKLDWSFIQLLGFLLEAALGEEIVFRFIPIVSALIIFKDNLPKMIMVIVASSVVFGLVHGQPINIAMQGVLGAVLSLVFLKCGGLNGNFIKALICSTISHFVYNIILLMISVI